MIESSDPDRDATPSPPMAEKALFHEALALPASEREAYLTDACCGDDRLREAVVALLAAHERPGMLPGPAPDEFCQPWIYEALRDELGEAERDASRTIGPYRVVRRLGEGGFGTVYLARREGPVELFAAVKVVKAGMDTRQVVARFEAEREALARMDHENIAKIYDAGSTDSGRPYFAMEFIEGHPLTEYCEVKRLGMRERLTLFLDVCSAVAHAHSKGVIHRDLKPANVLVREREGTPVIKVIDFGIAKAMEASIEDASVLTRIDQIVGTPAYMSPEQAAAGRREVDTRTDVYGLGVLLYELLSGQPPFDPQTLLAAGDAEMRRIIREQDPPLPSMRAGMRKAPGTAVLQRSLRGDLDWIVMKAIEKDRERRYATVDGLRVEIGRYLNDEVVGAGPPSTVYRLRKFARRHRAGLAAATGLGALLVAAAVGGTWLAFRARVAERQAELQAATERAARAEAEEMTNLLTGTLGGISHSDARTLTVADALDHAASRLDMIADRPDRRAAIQAALGKGYNVLGMFREAVALRVEVLDYRLRTVGADHPAALRAKEDLAVSYQGLERLDESTRLREEVLASRRAAPEIEGPLALSLAIEALAVEDRLAGRLERSRQLREELVAHCIREFGPDARRTLEAKFEWADAHAAMNEWGEAIRLYSEVQEKSRERFGVGDNLTRRTLMHLAGVHAGGGNRAQSVAIYEDLVELLADRPETDWEKLRVLAALGQGYLAVGRGEEGLALMDRVLTIRRDTVGGTHPDTLTAGLAIGNALSQVGRLEEARVRFMEVRENSQPDSRFHRAARVGYERIEEQSRERPDER